MTTVTSSIVDSLSVNAFLYHQRRRIGTESAVGFGRDDLVTADKARAVPDTLTTLKILPLGRPGLFELLSLIQRSYRAFEGTAIWQIAPLRSPGCHRHNRK